MTTDFRTLLENLVEEVLDANQHKPPGVQRAIDRACAALAEREPKRRYIYNPVQIAECGGPCEQGPEHCDCGELWMTEPEILSKSPTDEELRQLRRNHEWPVVDSLLFVIARAVLTRWGRSS